MNDRRAALELLEQALSEHETLKGLRLKREPPVSRENVFGKQPH
jgi:hypothetical protein